MLKLLALITTIVLTPSTPKEPVLKMILSNAGANYEAINPLLTEVAMTIDCGDDFEKTVLKLSPSTKEGLEIKKADGTDAICHLESWKRVK